METTTTLPDTLDFAALSDDELVERVKGLAACERRATVALIRSLIEFDTRQLYLNEGCSSLFAYCTQVLHLAEGSAYNRIETARAARRFPQVLEMLERGDLTLSAARMLAPHLTAENHTELLTAARHRSKLEIQELIASMDPAGAGVPASNAALVMPLGPDNYRLHVTLSPETFEKLQRARSLLRHTLPTGDVGSILDRALTLLIEQVEHRRFAASASARSNGDEKAASGRHIPAAVRRVVWRRDEGRCAFVGREGRCRETAFLEFHHVAPYAEGGAATAENIQLRCRAHNQYEARVFFGDSLVREQREVWTDDRPARELVPGQARFLRAHRARPPLIPAATPPAARRRPANLLRTPVRMIRASLRERFTEAVAAGLAGGLSLDGATWRPTSEIAPSEGGSVRPMD